ncbi:MAG: elongation factor Ts, partial [Coprobacillus cateniformis]
IKDPDQTVAKYLGNGKVLEMVRFQVGEGMEKREENFAEEVAAQMKG